MNTIKNIQTQKTYLKLSSNYPVDNVRTQDVQDAQDVVKMFLKISTIITSVIKKK